MTKTNQSRFLLLPFIAMLAALPPASGQFVRYPDPVDDPLVVGLEQFSSKFGGWGDFNTHPRFAADVNGDGRADIVGFGESGVWVSLAVAHPTTTGAERVDGVRLTKIKWFQDPAQWLTGVFTRSGGFTTQENFPRLVGDVNGDGKADVVGFGKDGAYVSVSTGNGFAPPQKWLGQFGPDVGGWTSFDRYPRLLGDVNGDGKADIVGFGENNTTVALSTGTSFSPGKEAYKGFCQADGWKSYDKFPRQLGDVNGDGKADIVGFGASAVMVSLSQGLPFQTAAEWAKGFVEPYGGWSSQGQFPRFVVDMNKDKKADIVGLGQETVAVSLSTGNNGFASSIPWSARMTNLEGFTDNRIMPRMPADYLGTGYPGLVGFSPVGVRVIANIEGKGLEQLEAPREFSPAGTFCWKDTYTRGGGTTGSAACAAGQEEWGGDCYPKCAAGMTGVGPVCWQTCPAGYTDIGVSCAKPKATSSAGFGWQFGDAAFDYDTGPRARCEAAHGAGKCYRSGLIWYPNCPAGFHKVGDLVCTPDCPAGMRDDGAFCAKTSTPRGAGIAKACGNGQVSSGGLCYPACNPLYDGVGPVCWSKCSGALAEPCGAGCATNQTTCVANIGLMTAETVGALSSLLSFAVGGPGVPETLKAAAKAAQQGAIKAGRNALAKSLWTSSMTRAPGNWGKAARYASLAASRNMFAKKAISTILKENVADPRNLFFRAVGVIKAENNFMFNRMLNESGQVKASGGVDLTDLMVLDLTGVSSAIHAFAKYSSCGTEPITPSVKSIDMGNIGQNAGSASVTIKVNKPTTFLHIGTPAYSNCRIVPSGTCAGKTLQPGESCEVTVKAFTGGRPGVGGNLLGELRIYTEDLSVVPYPIQLKANSGSPDECKAVPEVDEPANLTNLEGAWAWFNDINRKIVISADGTITPVGGWTAPGKVSVRDPNARTFTVKFGASVNAATGDVFTLSETNDTLESGNVQATKRPSHPRCAPGLDFNGAVCFDVPVGKAFYPDVAGAADPCPAGYYDSPLGNKCWPEWTGKFVWGTPAYPPIVTDCSMASCPAGFTKSACSCVANPIEKPVQKLTSQPPVN